MNISANDYDDLSGMIYDFLDSKGYVNDENTTAIQIQENLEELIETL